VLTWFLGFLGLDFVMLLNRGLGFVPGHDDRDGQYPLARLFRQSRPKLKSRMLPVPNIMDQGQTSECVAYSCVLALQMPPHALGWRDPSWIYREAKKIDGLKPGTDGTTLHAGFKVLKREGLIGGYWWASGVDEMVRYLLESGPIVVGTSWLSRMDHPNRERYCVAKGLDSGGHAYVVTGVDWVKSRFQLANSWGTGWGFGGKAWIRITDMDKLLKQGGQAAALAPPNS